MSHSELEYGVFDDRHYRSFNFAPSPTTPPGHHYNYSEQSLPYQNTDHASVHQSSHRYPFQGDIGADLDSYSMAHPVSSHHYNLELVQQNWLYHNRKPNLTFPTPAHVYELQNASNGLNAQRGLDSMTLPRTTLAGSLDPTTGIFYRTPDHPRLRTAQACEKCRTRKAKCSGEHPSCKRCINRGLVCEYAKEGRLRGPNKPKLKSVDSREEMPTVGSQSSSSRDGTPSHTAGPGSVGSSQDLSRMSLPQETHPSPTPPSFAEHRLIRPRPSSLCLSSETSHILEGRSFRGPSGRSPPVSSRRNRNETHGTLYSTTPLQSPTSPTFNGVMDMTHHSLPVPPDMNHGIPGRDRGYPNPTASMVYSQPPSTTFREELPDHFGEPVSGYSDFRATHNYSSQSTTHFNYDLDPAGLATSTYQDFQRIPNEILYPADTGGSHYGPLDHTGETFPVPSTQWDVPSFQTSHT